MLALLNPVKDRLQAIPAFIAWQLHTVAEEVNRQSAPRAEIGFANARVSSVRATAALVEPLVSVSLVVKRGEEAASLLEAAMQAAIQSLHNWHPGEQGGRKWEPMRLTQITEPDFAIEEGLIGLTLAFATQALYLGQP